MVLREPFVDLGVQTDKRNVCLSAIPSVWSTCTEMLTRSHVRVLLGGKAFKRHV